MNLEIPDSLNTPVNEIVLNYLKPLSCHGDNIEPLVKVLKNYPEVKSFCPNGKKHAYVFYYVQDIIFAFGVGMRGVALKVPKNQQENAMAKGATHNSEAGKDWYNFAFNSKFITEFTEISFNNIINT